MKKTRINDLKIGGGGRFELPTFGLWEICRDLSYIGVPLLFLETVPDFRFGLSPTGKNCTNININIWPVNIPLGYPKC